MASWTCWTNCDALHGCFRIHIDVVLRRFRRWKQTILWVISQISIIRHSQHQNSIFKWLPSSFALNIQWKITVPHGCCFLQRNQIRSFIRNVSTHTSIHLWMSLLLWNSHHERWSKCVPTQHFLCYHGNSLGRMVRRKYFLLHARCPCRKRVSKKFVHGFRRIRRRPKTNKIRIPFEKYTHLRCHPSQRSLLPV